jgi:signal transduction histidine kinase
VLEVAASLAVLLLAVRYPLMAWRTGYVTVLLVPLVRGEPRVDALNAGVMMVVFWVAGLRHTRQVLWWMAALLTVPVWIWVGPGWQSPAFATIGLVVVAVALDARATSVQARHELAALVEHAEMEDARRAVVDERTRIARDMHGAVVAHRISMIAVQAETAPYRLDGLNEATAAELATMSRSAREALADLRRLLGVLRGEAPVGRGAQPRLTDVPELVEATRHTGVGVKLSMPAVGDGEVSPAVGLCAYRIVQEALSYAARRSESTDVDIKIERDPGSLHLQVTNGTPGKASGKSSGERPGHETGRKAEGAAPLGGLLSARAAAQGDFAVSVVLPLGEPILRASGQKALGELAVAEREAFGGSRREALGEQQSSAG